MTISSERRLASTPKRHGSSGPPGGGATARRLSCSTPINFLHDIRSRLRDCRSHHHQMIDRHAAMRLRPLTRHHLGIGNERLEPRIGQGVADDGRVELAVEQHLHQRLAFRRARDEIRVLVLGEMRILERDPLHLGGIDAVIVGEKAAHPGAGRLRIGAHADPLAVEVGRPSIRRVADYTRWCGAGRGRARSPGSARRACRKSSPAEK